MSMPDPETPLAPDEARAVPASQPEHSESVDETPAAGEALAETAAPEALAQQEDSAPVDAPEPIIEETAREVTLQRSVRYGRILIGFALLGAVIGAIACTFYSIPEEAEYTLGQVVGFMIMIGGAVGLGVGALFALLLGRVAARKRGTGVAIQTDVR